MHLIELVGIALGSGAGTTTIAFTYACRFRIRRIVRAWLYGRKYDMTRNKKFVAHDRERHQYRLAAEDYWLAEWVALMRGRAPLGWHERHRLEHSTSEDEKARIWRDAERARIAEIVQEKRLWDRKKVEVLADAAKQIARQQLHQRMPWS